MCWIRVSLAINPTFHILNPPILYFILTQHLFFRSQIILASGHKSKALSKMLEVVHSELIPNKVVMLADDTPNEESFLYSRHSSLSKYHPKNTEECLVYVCHNFRCSLPVSKPDQLRDTLKSPVSN